ncbi:ureidoglycolate hydrolase [Thozetella sp. PMI_491]|nr:ureidoglycolate hydrolase [Thozetella sp. PMI_491]
MSTTALRAIYAEPLTEAAFASYGGLIAADLATPNTVMTNGGMSKRWQNVVQTENRYEQSSRPGRAVVNVSQASPRSTIDNGDGHRTFVLEMLERHLFTTQIFVPMTADAKYLVAVAESKTCDDATPDLGTLRAFVATSGQGICYRTGLWHAPMAVIGETAVTFAVFQHTNDVPADDCTFYPLAEGHSIAIYFPSLYKGM